MGTKTNIQWADSTWSPWRGCTKVSPGCANCYAETLAKRNPVVLGGWGRGAPRVLAKNWNEPAGWNRKATQRREEWENRWDGTLREAFDPQSIPDPPARPRVFPSLCDWLDPEVPAEWLARFLQLIHDTPSLNWLLLTKRPELWAERMRACIALTVASIPALEWFNGAPPPNVFMGVSVEDQARANERIPRLLEIPAVMRWLSVEPLIGPVDLTRVDGNQCHKSKLCMVDSLTGRQTDMGRPCQDVARVDWVVVGGESGKESRDCHADWIRRVVTQCKRSKVPVFVKQVGSNPVDQAENALLWKFVVDPKGGDPKEWPSELRVRELPALLT